MFAIHSSPLGRLGTRDTGGMSVYIRELAQWLGQWGLRVDIFTCDGSEHTGIIELRPNVRLIHLLPKGVSEISKEQLPQQLNAVFDAVQSYCRKHALVYDLIHSHYWLSGVVGDMARAIWHGPHVTMFHTLGMVKNSTASGENESDRRIAHERWLAKVADMIVVPAARERDHLIHLYNAPPQKIRIVPCGVNLERFKPMDRADSRRRLGIPMNAQVALFVGRFAPLKGIDALLGAMADLKQSKPDLHLMVVGGDGPEAPGTQALMQQVDALGLKGRVLFAGRTGHKKLPAYYCAADLLVVPSHYESFGLVVLEALACGTPVLATPVGAVETIIQPGVNGIIVDRPARDVVARGMVQLLEQRLHESKGPENIRATVSHCGWERIAAQVVQVYADLVQTHECPASHWAAGCSGLTN